MNDDKVQYLNRILFGLLGSQDLVDRWWASPNKAFNGLCPRDVDIVEVHDYLIWHAFCAGG